MTELWQTTQKADAMSCALLGRYQDEIFWQPAFLRLLDYLQRTGKTQSGQWLTWLVNVDPCSLVPQLRGTATKVYSAASKGVHHEFVLSLASYYDAATLNQLAEEVFRLVATMALITHFAESVIYPLKPRSAVSLYEAIQL